MMTRNTKKVALFSALLALVVVGAVRLSSHGCESSSAEVSSNLDGKETTARHEKTGKQKGIQGGDSIRPREVDSARRISRIAPGARQPEHVYRNTPRKELFLDLKAGEPEWKDALVAVAKMTLETYDACHHHLENDEVCTFDRTLVFERTEGDLAQVAWVEYDAKGSDGCYSYVNCDTESLLGKTVQIPSGADDIVAYRRSNLGFNNLLPSLLEDPKRLEEYLEMLEAMVLTAEQDGPDAVGQSAPEHAFYVEGLHNAIEHLREKQKSAAEEL